MEPSSPIFSNPNPAQTAAAVTPSDSTSFGVPARALYIGGAGNVSLLLLDGSAVTFSGLVAGSILPVMCRRVNAASTTATNIVALF